MLGRKQTSVSKTLAQRVQQISVKPTFAPLGPVGPKFGKRIIRTDAWRPATISFQTGERMDVVVKNITDSGARIEFVRSTYLPDRVKLTAPGVERWAYVAWESCGIAGLQFVSNDTFAAP